MPRKASSPDDDKRILVRPGKANPAEIAAAQQVIDAWQKRVWAQPLAERQTALSTLLEVLDA